MFKTEERIERENAIYGALMLETMLFGRYLRYRDFADEYIRRMKKEGYECTDEDIERLYDTLDRQNELDERAEKERKRRRQKEKEREKKKKPELKHLPCKATSGLWYYKKIIPNDTNGLTEICYELYDEKKKLKGRFRKYRPMFAAVAADDITAWMQENEQFVIKG